MSAEQFYTGDPEVDHLLFSWRRVIADATGWSRGFALSIQRARKRPGWTPSTRQLSVMRQLVAELPAVSGEGDGDLIDRD
ncbi:hypothetical protein H4P12_00125 [Paracoccus sp. 11-3]|uniref:Uncharacterized protein n=1 Tax=Paracoccus amoyensis TaxID=2760093 RepID=A0A926JBU3_9RHOB|nr:hypothetical protein [Paracoccus amoyensis]MBC9245153.1 hypothetical protein [Paracoccus amoyensis]